ncbi:galactose oxidase-like domain-containing protein [Streptomyces sp. NPDC014773]|uniref:galactose oxidase-like domain-containing protein n=1 Tax=Streptomyces sp. NPDC014773 TaxID=3364908 RepID=UPI003700B5D6
MGPRDGDLHPGRRHGRPAQPPRRGEPAARRADLLERRPSRGLPHQPLRRGRPRAAATHSTDNDQRRVPPASTAARTGTYAVSIPSGRSAVLPGASVLFALGAHGVPGTARFITLF